MSEKVSFTEADRVNIPIYLYDGLVRDSEKVSAVERYVKSVSYVSASDILAILGIEKVEKDNITMP